MAANSNTIITLLTDSANCVKDATNLETALEFIDDAIFNVNSQFYLSKRDPIDSIAETLSEFALNFKEN